MPPGGGGGAVQVHVTVRGLATCALSVKVNVLPWHGIFEIVTDCGVPPGVRVELGGEKPAALSLSLADQVILVLELASSVRVTVQAYVVGPPLQAVLVLSRLVGLTDHVATGGDGVGDGGGGGVMHVHVTVRGLATFALSVKVNVSLWHGIFEIVTDCGVPPGVRVELDGEKFTTPRLSLADQVILVLELAFSARVTVQAYVVGPPLQLVLVLSRLVGLTDHDATDGDGLGDGGGGKVGDGDGDRVGVGKRVGVGDGVAPITISVTAI